MTEKVMSDILYEALVEFAQWLAVELKGFNYVLNRPTAESLVEEYLALDLS